MSLLDVLLGGGLSIIGGMVGVALPPWLQVRSERRSLTSGLAAEIEGVIALVAQRGYVAHMKRILEELRSNPLDGNRWFVISARHDYFPVYRANVAKIGLLSPELATAVVRFYAGANAFLDSMADMREGRLEDVEHKECIRHLEEEIELLELVVGIGTEAVRLAR